MINRIKECLNNTTVINLMYALGVDRHIDHEEYIIFPTICHNDSSFNASMKLYYYKNSKNFNCFSNCSSFDVVELVQKVMDIDFKGSVSFLSKFFGLRDIYIPKGFGTSTIVEQSFEDEDVEIPIIENENIMNNFLDYYCCEWINEGISIDTMKKFNIKYYLHQHKIVIPHYNMDNKLIGIRGRALLQEDLDNGKKYMPICLGSKIYRHSLRHNLYGLNHNIHAIKKYKQVIIFESEKSVLKSDTFYGDESIAVAIGGSNISKHHINLLLECGVQECVIALDRQFQAVRDEEYLQWSKKIQKVIDRYGELIRITVIWDTDNLLDYRDSPIDRGKDTFEKLFNSRINFKEEWPCIL